MFDSLLIANRGEIACRIIATARRLGISTIAVYSDADKNAAHVAAADRALRIGAAPAAESYLNIPAVLKAAVKSGACAVHPGYGFLAENAEFSSAVAAAGLIYVGPSARVINRLGNKSNAKILARKSGVPVVPGYHGRGQSLGQLSKAAAKTGFPILIKAALGGGGRGMRVVETSDQMDAAIDSAAREAEASFGDPTLIIEKYLPSARHIEVQIFADNFGAVIHMGTRDCSVQRRYQKIIEEAPAPGLATKTAAEMIGAAITLVTASQYRGAGTVEFMLDRDNNFYFMEMNTRLQVEHPVTEAITGEDLVEWQLRIAAGESLPKQGKIDFAGHAIEARLCAEDPAQEFLPSVGRIDHLKWPAAPVRIDTGIGVGDTVSVHYDSLLAKLIVADRSRKRALAAFKNALETVQIIGPPTNLDFLRRVVELDQFASAHHDTSTVADSYDQLTGPAPKPADQILAAAAGAALCVRLDGKDENWVSPWQDQGAWRLTGNQPIDVALHYGGRDYVGCGLRDAEMRWSITLDNAKKSFQVCRVGDQEDNIFTVDGRSVQLTTLLIEGVRYFYFADGGPIILVDPLVQANGPAEKTGALVAPMPGRIARIAVSAGATVRTGDLLLVLEAMKMEHAVSAPIDGTVAEILFGEGDQVMAGAELARIAP